jgi:ATP-dependent DNA helicase RecQ
MSDREGGEWRGRFGRGRIVQCLLGSRSQEILAGQLDRLSTHGLLKNEGASYLNSLFREFLDQGLVTATVGQYPLLTLTAAGDAVMRGEVNPTLCWPESATRRERSGPTRSTATPSLVDGADAPLLAALRETRDRLAAEGGNLPRYLIFPDETLRAFARLRPRSIEAGRRIRGVGEFKAREYLPQFIEVIQRFETGVRAAR